MCSSLRRHDLKSVSMLPIGRDARPFRCRIDSIQPGGCQEHDSPMTTKLAAFFLLVFLYSAITSTFLLFVALGLIARLATPFVTSFGFGATGSLAFGFDTEFAAIRISHSSSTSSLCFGNNIVGARLRKVELRSRCFVESYCRMS